MCLFISTMPIGAWLVASSVGRVSSMYVAGRLLDMLLTAEAFTSVVYVFVVYGGRMSVMMYCSHEMCMVVSNGVVSLGSFLSSVVARSSRVALRRCGGKFWDLTCLHLGFWP